MRVSNTWLWQSWSCTRAATSWAGAGEPSGPQSSTAAHVCAEQALGCMEITAPVLQSECERVGPGAPLHFGHSCHLASSNIIREIRIPWLLSLVRGGYFAYTIQLLLLKEIILNSFSYLPFPSQIDLNNSRASI